MDIVTAECSVCGAKQTRLRGQMLGDIYCVNCGADRRFFESLNVGLRDQFAMAALQGMLAGINWTPGKFVHEDAIASDAYAIADEMLKARNEKTDNS